jgi:hypothetical protein
VMNNKLVAEKWICGEGIYCEQSTEEKKEDHRLLLSSWF